MKPSMKSWSFSIITIVLACTGGTADADPTELFDQVGSILSRRCLTCHSDQDAKGGLSLSTKEAFLSGGDSGSAIDTDQPLDSLLLEMISGSSPEMPKDADALKEEEVALIRQWLAAGAKWPTDKRLEAQQVTDLNWWSLKPLQAVAVPEPNPSDAAWIRTPIDAFVIRKLREQDLEPSAEANRRTLIRRLYFDLVGLPPTPERVEAFMNDSRSDAYERLVDELLESPHYGERWARHWLDVVHYGDTHGYDKDKLRPNAWPYRDYVIRSFNSDRPYSRFVQEQLAGDVLWPDTIDGIEATGFISAGPWDFIGHAEVPEEKLDGQVARYLDRDDMVTSTMNTFASTTVQCARCHNHKFDPVTQKHYYSLQAVFAALDRADREYDRDPQVAEERSRLQDRLSDLESARQQLEQSVREQAGEELVRIDNALKELDAQEQKDNRAEFGYHSQIESKQDVVKWVQVDLGESQQITEVILVGAHDDFNNIGAGFGFPVRYRVDASNDAEFSDDVTRLVDFTDQDVANPGTAPQTFSFDPIETRYLRVTATKLATRSSDYIFALGELLALNAETKNVAAAAKVTALDSIEAPVRWQKANLVDGFYRGATDSPEGLSQRVDLNRQRSDLLKKSVDPKTTQQLDDNQQQLAKLQEKIKSLPARDRVYTGTVHTGGGAFRGRGHLGGKPRDIHILVRGEITQPGDAVGPGTIPIIADSDWRFDLASDHSEGERRVALANWLVRHDNPLTWRSIVNRIWLYHFGRGIVDSPNDFGRMGQLPTHPELLDWLAIWFRDHGQSIKDLHRMLVNSATYRQRSDYRQDFHEIDASNRYLWRMNRRALEAEVIRDSVLSISGKLRPEMYGPGFRDFVLERPEHSPHYEYHKHDPTDVATHRRSVYRFLVRSQQQPFMQTLDCADPSQSVAKRDTTITAIQALTLMNNKFMVQMADDFATRLETADESPSEQIRSAYALAIQRSPSPEEVELLTKLAEEHGMANACRVVFNLNEFLFID